MCRYIQVYTDTTSIDRDTPQFMGIHDLQMDEGIFLWYYKCFLAVVRINEKYVLVPEIVPYYLVLDLGPIPPEGDIIDPFHPHYRYQHEVP